MSGSPAPLAAPAGVVPPNYREVLYWKITHSGWRLVVLNLLAFPLGAAWGVFFLWFAVRWGRLPDFRVGGVELLALFVAMLGTLALHELAHGIAMRRFGARPKYGVLWPGLMFYATAPGYAFARSQYLAVIFAPLVGLSLLAMMGMLAFAGRPVVALFAVCATVNAAGAIGDLWIAMIVARYAARAFVVDERDGLRVFLPA